MSDHDIGAEFLTDALRNFRSYKKLAEDALAQVNDDEIFRLLDPEANSIAIIIKHMAGNMRSRWTDFLTTDGEKPNRHRDQEFEIAQGTTRTQVMQWWEDGWECVFRAINPLKPDDLTRKVLIAGREHSVLQAISRQLLHYAGHVNQIVLLAKHFRGASWKSLSIPKGKSETFAREFEKVHAARSESR
ncbi:MAG TPA: DUF1572 family protein [Candidatus Sulfotelmatobacter sp.]|nr:DUF1572 family protein [Candidatus Sulfotelmatobacter sp.]